MTDIDDQGETQLPPAPGPATPALDTAKVNVESQPNGNGNEYLADKSELTTEGMINAFREMRELKESDDPVSAILVTEIQELKEAVAKTNVTLAILLPVGIVAAGCLALIMLDVNKGVNINVPS